MILIKIKYLLLISIIIKSSYECPTFLKGKDNDIKINPFGSRLNLKIEPADSYEIEVTLYYYDNDLYDNKFNSNTSINIDFLKNPIKELMQFVSNDKPIRNCDTEDDAIFLIILSFKTISSKKYNHFVINFEKYNPEYIINLNILIKASEFKIESTMEHNLKILPTKEIPNKIESTMKPNSSKILPTKEIPNNNGKFKPIIINRSRNRTQPITKNKIYTNPIIRIIKKKGPKPEDPEIILPTVKINLPKNIDRPFDIDPNQIEFPGSKNKPKEKDQTKNEIKENDKLKKDKALIPIPVIILIIVVIIIFIGVMICLKKKKILSCRSEDNYYVY